LETAGGWAEPVRQESTIAEAPLAVRDARFIFFLLDFGIPREHTFYMQSKHTLRNSILLNSQ
jgi:hypothetical protein